MVSIIVNKISILKPGYNFIHGKGYHNYSSGFENQTEFGIFNTCTNLLIIEAKGKSINFLCVQITLGCEAGRTKSSVEVARRLLGEKSGPRKINFNILVNYRGRLLRQNFFFGHLKKINMLRQFFIGATDSKKTPQKVRASRI